MKTTEGFRQGDVLAIPVTTIPVTATPVAAENGRLIVARGEATGHHHSFPWHQGAVLFRDDGTGGGGMYVAVTETIVLEHQEHAALTLAPGKYRLTRQRTYEAGMARRVED